MSFTQAVQGIQPMTGMEGGETGTGPLYDENFMNQKENVLPESMSKESIDDILNNDQMEDENENAEELYDDAQSQQNMNMVKSFSSKKDVDFENENDTDGLYGNLQNETKGNNLGDLDEEDSDDAMMMMYIKNKSKGTTKGKYQDFK